jgi:hypothetical protein
MAEFFQIGVDTRSQLSVLVQPDAYRGTKTYAGTPHLWCGHVTAATGNGWLAGLLAWRTRDGAYDFVPASEFTLRATPLHALDPLAAIEKARPVDDWSLVAGYADSLLRLAEQLAGTSRATAAATWDGGLVDAFGRAIIITAGELAGGLAAATNTNEAIALAAGLSDLYPPALAAVTATLVGHRHDRGAWVMRRVTEHYSSVARLATFLGAIGSVQPAHFAVAEMLATNVRLFPECRAAHRLLRCIATARSESAELPAPVVQAILAGISVERHAPIVLKSLSSTRHRPNAAYDFDASLGALDFVEADEPYQALCRTLRLAAFRHDRDQFRTVWLRRDADGLVPTDWMPPPPAG